MGVCIHTFRLSCLSSILDSQLLPLFFMFNALFAFFTLLISCTLIHSFIHSYVSISHLLSLAVAFSYCHIPANHTHPAHLNEMSVDRVKDSDGQDTIVTRVDDNLDLQCHAETMCSHSGNIRRLTHPGSSATVFSPKQLAPSVVCSCPPPRLSPAPNNEDDSRSNVDKRSSGNSADNRAEIRSGECHGSNDKYRNDADNRFDSGGDGTDVPWTAMDDGKGGLHKTNLGPDPPSSHQSVATFTPSLQFISMSLYSSPSPSSSSSSSAHSTSQSNPSATGPAGPIAPTTAKAPRPHPRLNSIVPPSNPRSAITAPSSTSSIQSLQLQQKQLQQQLQQQLHKAMHLSDSSNNGNTTTTTQNHIPNDFSHSLSEHSSSSIPSLVANEQERSHNVTSHFTFVPMSHAHDSHAPCLTGFPMIPLLTYICAKHRTWPLL